MHCNAWMMCHLVVWSTYNQEFAETLGIWFHEKFRYAYKVYVTCNGKRLKCLRSVHFSS